VNLDPILPSAEPEVYEDVGELFEDARDSITFTLDDTGVWLAKVRTNGYGRGFMYEERLYRVLDDGVTFEYLNAALLAQDAASRGAP
jgi:hypothetical protein